MVRIDLDGKVAVVTGGSRGIGAAIAKTLAAAGASVLVLYRQDEAAAQALVAEIGAAGGIAWPQQTDVRDARELPLGLDRFDRLPDVRRRHDVGLDDQQCPLPAVAPPGAMPAIPNDT